MQTCKAGKMSNAHRGGTKKGACRISRSSRCPFRMWQQGKKGKKSAVKDRLGVADTEEGGWAVKGQTRIEKRHKIDAALKKETAEWPRSGKKKRKKGGGAFLDFARKKKHRGLEKRGAYPCREENLLGCFGKREDGGGNSKTPPTGTKKVACQRELAGPAEVLQNKMSSLHPHSGKRGKR